MQGNEQFLETLYKSEKESLERIDWMKGQLQAEKDELWKIRHAIANLELELGK